MNKKDINHKTIKLTPDEIDEIIQKWNATKKEIKRLQETEEKCRLVIGKIMDNFGIDIIRGKESKVSRYNIDKRFFSRENVPEEIYNRYSVKKSITMYRVSKK